MKTTGLGMYFPFYATATEVRCSEEAADRFHLYLSKPGRSGSVYTKLSEFPFTTS